MAMNEDRLEYWNKTSYFCAKRCGCSEHGFPGHFPKEDNGVLLVSQFPGYSRMPYEGQKKRTWEYQALELSYEEFQSIYFNEFASNRSFGSFYALLARHLGLKGIESLAFTSLVKCPFKDNDFKEEAIQPCKWLLKGQIDALEPDVIVALGRGVIDFFGKGEVEGSIFNLLYPFSEGAKVQKVIAFETPARIRNQDREAKRLASLIRRARGV